jgi:hypothetical protein
MLRGVHQPPTIQEPSGRKVSQAGRGLPSRDFAEEKQEEEDPLADICILLQAAGDRGVDLNKWLTHYDKTGTGVLRRRDLHRAVTSLGLGVSVGESECDEQTAERALGQRSFDTLVEYWGGSDESDIVPYSRLLTMVPSLMETRRQRETKEEVDGGVGWIQTVRSAPTSARSSRSSTRSSTSRKSRTSRTTSPRTTGTLGLPKMPQDMQATLGQERARERVRQRVHAEKIAKKKEEEQKMVVRARVEEVCDTVSLTQKMRKATQRRRQKKTEKAARDAAQLLEMQNATNLEDLLQKRLSSRTVFGDLLRSLRFVTMSNGVTSERRTMTITGLTKVVHSSLGLRLPVSRAVFIM